MAIIEIQELAVELDRTLDLLRQPHLPAHSDELLSRLRVLRAVINDLLPKEAASLAQQEALEIKPEHPTARPWRIGLHGSVVADVPIYGGVLGTQDHDGHYGGHLVCETITPSNAALVVHAVNVFENLVTLLRAIQNVAINSRASSVGEDMEIIRSLAAMAIEQGKVK